jgi:outer membrane protein TolC
MAKVEVGRQLLEVASETRKAWYSAVAAEETVRYMTQVKDAAEASAELARRMARAGNFSRRDQMREQLFYAGSVSQLARAEHIAMAERERLVRLMGLQDEHIRLRLPERLPDLPAAKQDLKDAEETAMAQRFDVQAMKRETEATAEALGLTKTTRFINVLEIGRARTKEGEDPFAYGYTIGLEVPLFDWGGARVAKAEAIYMQSVSRLAETAVNARSQVRESYSAYRTAYDTARHYRDEIVPLRKRLSEENLLRYNGMLISVFELLADAREQVASVSAYIDALREFWIADADLKATLTGASRAGTGSAARRSTIPVAASGGH